MRKVLFAGTILTMFVVPANAIPTWGWGKDSCSLIANFKYIPITQAPNQQANLTGDPQELWGYVTGWMSAMSIGGYEWHDKNLGAFNAYNQTIANCRKNPTWWIVEAVLEAVKEQGDWPSDKKEDSKQ